MSSKSSKKGILGAQLHTPSTRQIHQQISKWLMCDFRKEQRGTTHHDRTTLEGSTSREAPRCSGEPLGTRHVFLVPSPGFLPFPTLQWNQNVHPQKN